MNEIKTHGEQTGALVDKVRNHLAAQQKDMQALTGPEAVNESIRLQDAEPGRWASMAKTDFQNALMKLVRAVAQPTTF